MYLSLPPSLPLSFFHFASLLISQVAGAVATYSIRVPSALRGMLSVLAWFELDFWGEPFLAHACAGGYLTYTLLTATVPLVLALANLVRVTVKELKREKVRG